MGEGVTKRPILRCFLAVLLMLAPPCVAQDRFDSGQMKGFTKSPTEHIVITLEVPITVYAVQGTVLLDNHDDQEEPIGDVIFELRGPGTSECIRATRSKENGRFKITRVPFGSYIFKATKDGYQSVVGTLILSKEADRRNRVTIKLPVGV